MKRISLLLLVLLFAAILIACGGAATPTEAPEEPSVAEPAEPPPEGTVLSMWYHGAGNPEERSVILQIIEDFNASQSQWVVELEEFPQASYNESIVAAALAGNLPDIIDMDGPVMPNWAWAAISNPFPCRLARSVSYPAPLGNGTARSTRSACGTRP